MIINTRVVFFTPLLFLILVLAACQGAIAGPANYTLSGKLLDRWTGTAISGLTVEFAARTTTTGADGSFSFDLGTSGASSGTFCVHGTGYGSIFAEPLSVSAGQNSQVTLFDEPLATSPTHQVTIKILDSGANEITAGTNVSYSVFNHAGGTNYTTYQYPYTTNGLVVDTPTFGTDCIVVAVVYLATPFTVMKRQVDLSASSTTVTLTQDNGAFTTNVNVAGDAAGNAAVLSLKGPYGAFYAAGGQLAGSPATATVAVPNPYGYGGIWMQAQRISNYLGSGLSKMVGSMANTTSIGTSVSLPALNSSLGPNAIPDANSIAYSGGNLSLSAVAGANAYLFVLYDSTLSASVGRLYSTSPSVTLPSWLQAQLSTHSVQVTVVPIGTNVALDLSALEPLFGVDYMRIGYGLPVADGLQFGVLEGNDFYKTLTF